jgi:hypothetical protein
MKYHITIPINGNVKNISMTLIIHNSYHLSENGHKNRIPYVVHRSKNICDSIETSVISDRSFHDERHVFVRRDSIRHAIGAMRIANTNECVTVLCINSAHIGSTHGRNCNTISISGALESNIEKPNALLPYFFHRIACTILAPKTACEILSIQA